MKTATSSLRWLTFFFTATFFLSSFQRHGSLQQGPPLKQGVFRIKVTEGLASQLERAPSLKPFTGEVVTGVATLDQLNRRHEVRRMKRVFRPAGKFEARHRRYGLHLWYELEIGAGQSVSDAMRSFKSYSAVTRTEPVLETTINRHLPSGLSPKRSRITPPGMLPGSSNDPMLQQQWHFNNTGQTGGREGADISLVNAWKLETGNRAVIVAVVDQGIQVNHEDLAANMWVNEDEMPQNNIDDDNNGYVDDVHGYSFVNDTGEIVAGDHGTHVAGTIAAVTNNSVGVAGVAGGSGVDDGVRLMSCMVFSGESGGEGFAEAYVYSADNGAVISQNSWGYVYPEFYEQVVLDAIDYFIAEAGKDLNGDQQGPVSGGLVCFSSGNSGSEQHYYPAFYEPVLAVASSTHEDRKAGYSNYGSWVDITAPGGETWTALEQGVYSTLSGNTYGYLMGTSMACPHVSGVAALIASSFGKAGFQQSALRERILHSIDQIDSLNPSYAGKLGAGRLNAWLAVRKSDEEPPARVTDLVVSGKAIGEITLSWTSPDDESGYLVEYDLRYSTAPLTAENFSHARRATGVPVPQPPGTRESFAVRPLEGGTLYYFALRSIDFEGNVSSISNVVKETSPHTPAMVTTPSSFALTLKTALRATRTLTIKNEGKGTLEFSVQEPTNDNPFYTTAPSAGEVAPGAQLSVLVTFDASGLFAGTYRDNLVVLSNDPIKPAVTIPLTLSVINNGLPIASVAPPALDFKAAQLGHPVYRTVSVSNAGSEALVISEAVSSHPAFGATTPLPMTIPPFTSAPLSISFGPLRTGTVIGTVSLQSNDPVRPVLKIKVTGEGLNESPVALLPASFNETLERGTSVTRNLVIRNNGSQAISYRMAVKNTRLAPGQEPAALPAFNDAAGDSIAFRRQEWLKKHEAKLAEKYPGGSSLLTVLKSPAGNAGMGAASVSAAEEDIEVKRYQTGFEEFTPGNISEQQGWFAVSSYEVSQEDPDRGSQHLRGTSAIGGAEVFCLSPYLNEPEEYDLPRFSTTTMRLNLDDAAGTTWQIVPQDPWSFVATRIRINADRTIDAMVIDDEYETHFRRVPFTVPEGYFDVAIEHDSWGNDTTGFSTYRLFINNRHVFAGTSLGFTIGQVAFVTGPEATTGILDVDEFFLSGNEFLPALAEAEPQAGVLAGGQSANLAVKFDATVRKYGRYEADLLIYIDEVDSLVVPLALSVSGEPIFYVEWFYPFMETNKGEEATVPFTIRNLGGSPVSYEFELPDKLPGFNLSASKGTLDVRETLTVNATFSGPPGLYTQTMVLRSDAHESQQFTFRIIVYDSGGVFYSPDVVNFEIPQGRISTRSFQVRNDGINTVSYTASSRFFQIIGIDPEAATIADDPVDIVLTIDARGLMAGDYYLRVIFNTNEINRRTVITEVWVNVTPGDMVTGSVLEEVWTAIPGREVSAIPVNTQPSFTRELSFLEAPQNVGDNFGRRIRGYLLVPEFGDYTFWIASNDNSELWLSTDHRPENSVKIASVTGYTNPRQWDKFPSQQSAPVYLESRLYYFEVLHKEGVGTDHVAVGWQFPSERLERPIPGIRLARYQELHDSPPTITIVSPAEGEQFIAPATIEIRTEPDDDDIIKVEFYNGAQKLGVDIDAPYSFAWKDVPPGDYMLGVKVFDSYGGTDSATVNIVVEEGQGCDDAGHMVWERWSNIPGTLISSIPLMKPPSMTETRTIFEARHNVGDNYGARMRGFICVPQTGEYTFWIASNDKSELWLSTDEHSSSKAKIAYVSAYTDYRQWSKYPSQKSARIHLVAGRRYYVEALHKEGVGADHLSVGWQLPDGKTMERPIPGSRLLPFNVTGNRPPWVVIKNPGDGDFFTAPATVLISAEAGDDDGGVTKVEFFTGTRKLGEDATPPYTYSWRNVGPGNHALTAVATDNTLASATSAAVVISVAAPCIPSGRITREYWSGIPGNLVSYIPVKTTPDGVTELTSLEGPVNSGINYGARISGYICPPMTGNYSFWIASNDHSELWLSSDDNAQNKVKIAYVTGATDPRQWTKFPSQRSATIPLTAGRTYYIEALHKQGIGMDHVAVGWQLPDGTLERPVGGHRLSPAVSVATTRPGENHPAAEEVVMRVEVFPNPVENGKQVISVHTTAPHGVVRHIEILELTGVSVYRQTDLCTDDCTAEIDLKDRLRPGVYILQVKLPGSVMMEKLLIR